MTETTDIDPTPPEQPQKETEAPVEDRQTLLADIGRRLREARESRRISIDEVARELKLRAVYLAALEKGHWDTLPGDVYGIGFTRQYARFLGLDLEEDIARIKSGTYQLTRPLTFPDPPIAPAKRWAVTATLLFIVLLIAFNVFHSANHEHKQAPAPLASTAPPSPVPAQTAPAATAATAQPPAAKQSAQEAPVTPSPSAAAQPSPAPLHSFRFTAVGEDVWLQLYRSHGDTVAETELLKEVLLRKGESMKVDTDADALLMNCGNAGALQVTVDDKPLIDAGTLGPMGKVIRDYRLSPPTP